MVCTKDSFLHVTLMHSDLVIARPQIQLGKVFGTMQFIQQLLYDRISIRPYIDWIHTGLQVNVVILPSLWRKGGGFKEDITKFS